MNGVVIRALAVALLCTTNAVTLSDENKKLTDAVQYAINWYRLWYGEPKDTSARKDSSPAWAVLIDKRAYVALPDIGLAVELTIGGSKAWPKRVEELPAGIGGMQAVNAYIERLRNEAEYEAAGKIDRFDLPRRRTEPILEEIRRGDFRIVEFGLLFFEKQQVISPPKEEQATFLAEVKSTLLTDAGLLACQPKRAVVPQYGIDDPIVFVLVENDSSECGDFVLLFERDGTQWHSYDKLSNRFGELDNLIQRILSRVGEIIGTTGKTRGKPGNRGLGNRGRTGRFHRAAGRQIPQSPMTATTGDRP